MKKGIFLTARVHPGEPNSSYMVKGAIDFLLSDSKEAKMLRSKFVFKVVPMLNPDGVVYGNYRCSLLGVDLNRRWKHPNKTMHPTIFYTKKVIEAFSEERELAMFSDLHGHSIKKDVFAYACCYKRCDVFKVKENLLIRLVPYLLSKTNPLFSYENSHFRVEKSKTGTGRVVNFKEHKILNSYTIEASFFGSSTPNSHYTTPDLESIGKDLCSICSVFAFRREFQSQIKQLTEYLKTQQSSQNTEKKKLGIRPEVSVKPNKEQEEEQQGEEPSFYDEEVQENSNFCIKKEIKDIEEVSLSELYIPEENEESGGSDSQASLNDDRKLKFLLDRNKKSSKVIRKVSQSPARANKALNSSTGIKCIKSLTPELVPKSRARSRNTFKRRDEVVKQIIPAKIMLKSPFLEENFESQSKNSNSNSSKSSQYPTIKETTQPKPLRRLDEILKELGLTDTMSRKTPLKPK